MRTVALAILVGTSSLPLALSQCTDGIDNDRDGTGDWWFLGWNDWMTCGGGMIGFCHGSDPGCDGPLDDDERGPAYACDNGLDDDGDGAADYPDDAGCSDADDGPFDRSEQPQCSDGMNNDPWQDKDVDYPADSGCDGPDGDREYVVRAR